MPTPAGLYVHVPFCAKKCHYCDFVTAPAGDPSAHAAYLSALAREAAARSERFSSTEFETLYVGGGTPSALSADEAEELFRTLRRTFRFRDGAEVTLEANPGDVTPEKAVRYRSLGVTRVSVGAQVFDDAALAALNRAHGVSAIGATFAALRGAGFDNVSLDLMLSLPGATRASLARSLEAVAALSPEHVSLYELVIEDRTVFGQRRREGRLPLPDEALQLAMLEEARGFLKARGWRHYELLNYARPGFESRHNLLYWSNSDYLGLGPGAFSYFDGRRFRTADSHSLWLEKAARGDFEALEEDRLDEEKKQIESLLLALRLTEGAALERFDGVLRKLAPGVESLSEKGLVERAGGRLRLTARGQLFAETVFAELSSV
ncbi:MAG TPA: radical SAM family heme chaperone HemW [Candidatus Eisenbacteria bacterium]|nr:radical SAM family heme chaperone HemW [Candidatus Eisenbacteria bacterium]